MRFEISDFDDWEMSVSWVERRDHGQKKVSVVSSGCLYAMTINPLS
jgi:hypothetical protein